MNLLWFIIAFSAVFIEGYGREILRRRGSWEEQQSVQPVSAVLEPDGSDSHLTFGDRSVVSDDGLHSQPHREFSRRLRGGQRKSLSRRKGLITRPRNDDYPGDGLKGNKQISGLPADTPVGTRGYGLNRRRGTLRKRKVSSVASELDQASFVSQESVQQKTLEQSPILNAPQPRDIQLDQVPQDFGFPIVYDLQRIKPQNIGQQMPVSYGETQQRTLEQVSQYSSPIKQHDLNEQVVKGGRLHRQSPLPQKSIMLDSITQKSLALSDSQVAQKKLEQHTSTPLQQKLAADLAIPNLARTTFDTIQSSVPEQQEKLTLAQETFYEGGSTIQEKIDSKLSVQQVIQQHELPAEVTVEQIPVDSISQLKQQVDNPEIQQRIADIQSSMKNILRQSARVEQQKIQQQNIVQTKFPDSSVVHYSNTDDQQITQEEIIQHTNTDQTPLSQINIAQKLADSSVVQQSTLEQQKVLEQAIQQEQIEQSSLQEQLAVQQRQVQEQLPVDKEIVQQVLEQERIADQQQKIEQQLADTPIVQQSTLEQQKVLEQAIQQEQIEQASLPEQLAVQQLQVEEQLPVEKEIVQQVLEQERLADQQHKIEQQLADPYIVQQSTLEQQKVLEQVVQQEQIEQASLPVQLTVQQLQVEEQLPADKEIVQQVLHQERLADQQQKIEQQWADSPLFRQSALQRAIQQKRIERMDQYAEQKRRNVFQQPVDRDIVQQVLEQERLADQQQKIEQQLADPPIIQQSTLQQQKIEQKLADQPIVQQSTLEQQKVLEQAIQQEQIEQATLPEQLAAQQLHVEEQLPVDKEIVQQVLEQERLADQQQKIEQQLADPHIVQQSTLEQQKVLEQAVQQEQIEQASLPVQLTVQQLQVEEQLPVVKEIVQQVLQQESLADQQYKIEQQLADPPIVQQSTLEQQKIEQQLSDPPIVQQRTLEQQKVLEQAVQQEQIEQASLPVQLTVQQLQVEEQLPVVKEIVQQVLEQERLADQQHKIEQQLADTPVVQQNTLEQQKVLEQAIQQEQIEQASLPEQLAVQQLQVEEQLPVDKEIVQQVLEQERLADQQQKIEQQWADPPLFRQSALQRAIQQKRNERMEQYAEQKRRNVIQHPVDKEIIQQVLEQERVADQQQKIEQQWADPPLFRQSALQRAIQQKRTERMEQYAEQKKRNVVQQVLNEEHLSHQINVQQKIDHQEPLQQIRTEQQKSLEEKLTGTATFHKDTPGQPVSFGQRKTKSVNFEPKQLKGPTIVQQNLKQMILAGQEKITQGKVEQLKFGARMNIEQQPTSLHQTRFRRSALTPFSIKKKQSVHIPDIRKYIFGKAKVQRAKSLIRKRSIENPSNNENTDTSDSLADFPPFPAFNEFTTPNFRYRIMPTESPLRHYATSPTPLESIPYYENAHPEFLRLVRPSTAKPDDNPPVDLTENLKETPEEESDLVNSPEVPSVTTEPSTPGPTPDDSHAVSPRRNEDVEEHSRSNTVERSADAPVRTLPTANDANIHPGVSERISAPRIGDAYRRVQTYFEGKCKPISLKARLSFQDLSLRDAAVAAGAGDFLSISPRAERILEQIIQKDGEYTVFLPSDDSLFRVPHSHLDYWFANDDLMTVLLKNHVISERLSLDDLVVASPFQKSAGGGTLHLSNNGNETFNVNGRRIIHSDVPGPRRQVVIHVLDGFLYPTSNKDIIGTLIDCEKFGVFLDLVKTAELTDILKSEKLTLFVPTNEALSSIPSHQMQQLKQDKNALREFLLYHTVNGAYYSSDIRDGYFLLTLLNRRSLQVRARVDGCYRRLEAVNNSPVIKSDIPATNGVIHVIDKILTPFDLDYCDDPLGYKGRRDANDPAETR